MLGKLGAEGEVIVDSFVTNTEDPNKPPQNLGCPWTEEEKAAFRVMLVDEVTEDEIDEMLSRLGKKNQEAGAGQRP